MKFKNQILSVTTIALASTTAVVPAGAQSNDAVVQLFHRFADEPARSSRISMFDYCSEKTGIKYEESYVPSEQYEVQLPIQLSSSSTPDIYALWPGGRSQFQAENGRIVALGDDWDDIKDNIWPGVQATSTEPDGNVYGIPYTFLPNMLWYNTGVFKNAGAEIPTNWDEMLDAAAKIKASGVTPFIIGSKHGYEPLFWFDYLILRTAGSEFRARLMAGEESYLDPKVVKAMELWSDLITAGYFNENYNSLSWREMVSAVAQDRGAMMLMGPWIFGSFTEAGLKPTEDFSTFLFPEIDPEAGLAVEGAVSSFSLSGAGQASENAMTLLKCTTELKPQESFATMSQQLAAHPGVTVASYDDVDVHPFIETYFATMSQPFHQNLELAAHPGVTEVAKREMPRFMTFPDQYMDVLESLEERRLDVHGK